ncbi:hypothetical protein GGD81_002944 [Rhodobium orientis]|nr:hypothetical protein [Rhodobium orientis]MBB4303892.1 hypothetical protein [Rhodobium orientis]
MDYKTAEAMIRNDKDSDLDRLYKPVGIAAVSAAAICCQEKKDAGKSRK